MKQNSAHFLVAITANSLFILCLFFFNGEKKRERESNGDKDARSSVSSLTFCYMNATFFSKWILFYNLQKSFKNYPEPFLNILKTTFLDTQYIVLYMYTYFLIYHATFLLNNTNCLSSNYFYYIINNNLHFLKTTCIIICLYLET